MNDVPVNRITDVAALKAITHPLRVRLLGALRLYGPATASALARRFGENSGSTSYHLRELAKHGFVEPDPVQDNARDKRWRATAIYTSWSDSDFTDAEGRELTGVMLRRQLGILGERADQHLAADLSDEWREALGVSDYAARLTPESVRELQSLIRRAVDELRDRDRDKPDAEIVLLYHGAFRDLDEFAPDGPDAANDST